MDHDDVKQLQSSQSPQSSSLTSAPLTKPRLGTLATPSPVSALDLESMILRLAASQRKSSESDSREDIISLLPPAVDGYVRGTANSCFLF